MALVIEDGSAVAGANSYVTAAEVREYAETRGIVIANNIELDGMAVQAADYLETFADEYKGSRKTTSQGLSWPRTHVVINCESFPDDEIPVQLKNAQCQAVIEIVNGADLMPNITGYAVRREKVDVIEREYAVGGGTNSTATPVFSPKYSKLNALLKSLLRGTAGLLPVYRA